MGFFLTLLITAALFAVSELIRPKADIEEQRPAGLGDFNFPTASEDRFNPIVWGTVMLEGPNVVWWGDLYPKAIHRRQKSNLFLSESVKIGYAYFVGIQMALCRGVLDGVLRILVGEKEIFSGLQGEGQIVINKPDLFGGEEQGTGGIAGLLDVLVGTTTQAPNDYLADFQTISTAITPASPRYGGSAYVVFRRGYVGTSTQIQAWKFEVRRIPNGLGLAAGEATLNGNDVNPANVIYEILTDSEWGLGYPTAAIDTSNFATVASTLATENNGFSFVLDKAMEAPDLLSELERQIDGVVRVNRVTGKWEIKLARPDYDIDTVPQITDDEVRSVDHFTRGEWTETTNEIRVIFSDRANDYKSKPALAQDAANIEIQGRVVPARMEFPGVKDADLANEIAWRVLRTLSYPLARARLKVDRTFYALNRGDVIAWTNEERGITKMGMRIQKIDYGTIQEGTIELELVEDVFRSDAASFAAPGSTKWTHPAADLQPFETDEQIAFEAPRKFLTLEGTVADRIWCGGRQQDVASSFKIYERHAAGTPSGDYAEAGEVFGFLLIGKLLGALSAGSAIPLSTLVLDPDPDIQASIRDAFTPDTVENIGIYLVNLILVEDEFMLVSSAQDVGANVQLNDVYRGALHSVQDDHAAGTPVWLLFVAGGLTDTVFPAGDNVDIKLLPRSRSDEVAVGDATEISIALANVLRRPYPPSRILLNSSAYPASCSLEGVGSDGDDYGVEIDWTRRDFRTVDEVEALTTDAATLFPDFPTVNLTKYTVNVREDPSGSNLLVQTFTDIQPTQTVLRNEILKVTDGVIPSELRFLIDTAHTLDSVAYSALQQLVYDASVTTGLTGQFNFGALNGYEVSNVYTATVAGTYAFTLANALPSSTTTVEYRLNGGAWATLIAATGTTGSIVGVVATDTIEIRHTEVAADLRRFIAMDAPGAGQDGYAVLWTGAFAPDSLEELTAWWNFADLADMNLSGTTILGVYDKSGNGNDLVQSGINRPNYTTIGGMYMGNFNDGTPTWLYVGDDTALNFGSGDFTICIIYKTADNDRAALIDKGVTLKYFCRVNDVDVSPSGKFRFDINDGTTYSVLDSAIDYADDTVRMLTLRRDGNNLRSYADGVETAASPTDITGVGTIDDASSLYVAIRQGTSQGLTGQIGEIVMYKGTITTAELALVHDWLKTKWGIS